MSVARAGVSSDVASGVCELAGNGVVTALGTAVSVGVACGVSVCTGAGVTGLGADVAAPAGGRYSCHHPSWGRGLFPASQQGRENNQNC